ncbi:hypothetical protein DS901_17860 [Loktanella sp. D2R18]|nr:hypothetical protein DS901_17860 [Loktanella sp. D2R18]
MLSPHFRSVTLNKYIKKEKMMMLLVQRFFVVCFFIRRLIPRENKQKKFDLKADTLKLSHIYQYFISDLMIADRC